MRVSEIMSTPVRTIEANETAATAWERMRLYRTRHLIVTGAEGRVVGVLAASDLGGKQGESVRARRRVADLMTEKVVPAQLDTTVREAANLMRGHVINCLPVFDGHRLKGVVTALDLLELIGRGAERPMTTAVRRVMKNRGVSPPQAKAGGRAARSSR
jgi:CBS domain-containing protein